MNIQFLKDTSTSVINDNPVDTFLVYRDGYKLPTLSGVEYLDFEKFKTKYSELHINKLIVVGLNRIITPSNRCDMVNDFIQTMTRNITKVSIDLVPFIGEPWRLWYHYDVTNNERFGLPHGFAVETEWSKWFYREQNDCRLSGDNIKMFISNTYSDLDLLTTNFIFQEPSEVELSWYENVKSIMFEKYDTPRLLINNILKESNKHFGLDISYDSFRTNKEITLPDLPIYQFMVEENKRRMSIFNKIIR
jgi:hypothetical protein